jgi:hypothetical protein
MTPVRTPGSATIAAIMRAAFSERIGAAKRTTGMGRIR